MEFYSIKIYLSLYADFHDFVQRSEIQINEFYDTN